MKTVYLIFFTFLPTVALTQNIPEPPNWETEEDYKRVEDAIVENILWLEENPITKDDEKAKLVYEYVLRWLVDCTYIIVEVEGDFITPIDTNYKYNSTMTVAYMLGKGLYAIREIDQNRIDAVKRGVLGMIYTYNSILKSDVEAKNETLEKYKNLYGEGLLRNYIEENLTEIKKE